MDSLRTFGRCKLLVHTRRVTTPDGELAEEHVVMCPNRNSAASLEQCAGCADYGGQAFDSENRRSFVVCSTPTLDPCPLPVGDALVGEVMKSQVLCVEESITREALAELFEREMITSAPVVDTSRRAVGMVSTPDLLRGTTGSCTASDLMMPLPFAVSPRTKVSDAAALMAFEGVHQLPVVADDERVVGLITALDVVRWVARRAGHPVPEELTP